jgi:hypothetical protein
LRYYCVPVTTDLCRSVQVRTAGTLRPGNFGLEVVRESGKRECVALEASHGLWSRGNVHADIAWIFGVAFTLTPTNAVAQSDRLTREFLLPSLLLSSSSLRTE